MVVRARLTRKLRELGYHFDIQTGRVDIWKRAGSTHRVVVQRKDSFSEDEVRSVLRQCGCAEDEIKALLTIAMS